VIIEQSGTSLGANDLSAVTLVTGVVRVHYTESLGVDDIMRLCSGQRPRMTIVGAEALCVRQPVRGQRRTTTDRDCLTIKRFPAVARHIQLLQTLEASEDQ